MHATHLEIHERRVAVAGPRANLHRLLVPLMAFWLLTTVAISQCQTVLQSGGLIAGLRGRVLTTQVMDPDGAGPMGTSLVVGGLGLTGGDQTTPVGVMVYDGAQWRGIGFDDDGPVHTLANFNGELVVGGVFTLPAPGGSANGIARWDGVTWQRLGPGVSGGTGPGGVGIVSALALFNGELIAGGSFHLAGGVAVSNIARWNGASWLATGSSSIGFSTVQALEPFGGSLYASVLSTANGNEIWAMTGTVWSSVTFTNSGTITSLRAINGTTHATAFLYAAGNFNVIGGTPAVHVAVAPFGVTSWSAVASGLPQLTNPTLLARTLLLGGNDVVAAGGTTNSTARVWRRTASGWTALGNLGPATGIANANGPSYYSGYVVGLDEFGFAPRSPSVFRFSGDWIPLLGRGIPTPVQCLTFDGDDAIAGGAFTAIDGVVVNGIARRSGTTWSALGTGMSGGSATVLAVVRASNGEVFAGGSFTTAGGNAASNVARWDGAAWAPLGTGTNGTVAALMLADNGDLLAGGDFTDAGGVTCNRIARWNGSAWSSLASGMNNSVRCLVQTNTGEIVAGGTFTLAGGVGCSRVARWNGIAWSSMNVGMNDAVNALELRTDGELIAGGAFTTVGGGSPCQHLARWSGSSWLSLSVGLPDTVNALEALPDGDLLIGGLFATGGFSHLARWNRVSNTIASIGLGLDGPDVRAMASAPDGSVFIGGDFETILPTQAAGYLAILATNCSALATSTPTACVGPGGPLSLVADTLPWAGSTFQSTATGFAPLSIAISVLGFTPINLPLSLVLPTGLPNCNLLASPDELVVAVPVAGASHYQFAVPDNAAFAGIQLSHQLTQLEFAPSGAIQSLSSSNALTLVLGLL